MIPQFLNFFLIIAKIKNVKILAIFNKYLIIFKDF